jgi:four helix bundle protein
VVENNVLAEKSIEFAIRIVNCYKYLTKQKHETVMSKQVLRSGTSIGANVHEAIYAQSKADFVNKMNISMKEAGETSYWLTILHRTEYIDTEMYNSIDSDLKEILKILASTIKTSKINEQQNV